MSGPYSVVLHFSSPAPLNDLTPEVVHAAFLSHLRRGDSSLAKLLHTSGMGRRPFSLAALGYPGQRDRLTLRVGILSPALFEQFWARWEKRGGISLSIGRKRLRPVAIGKSGPWIGNSDWMRLLKQEPIKKIKLFFYTPTAFRQGDTDLPLPVPRLIFRGLLARWNAFAPFPLPLNTQTIDRKIAVSSAHIQTRIFFDGRAHIPGFVGPVEFRVLRGVSADEMRAISALADLAFFSGVGRKTTHGMGLVRRLT